jgi:NAD(P)-dependent dehydrogenase (short-subunit alcohol dehydrogenase family)
MILKEKTAIITGGGSGIGLECAKIFSENGANVVVFGRRKSRLERAIKEIGENAIFIQGDIAQEKDIKELINISIKQFGRIDILVNNAGTSSSAATHKMEDSHWDSIMDVNLRGAFRLSKHVLPHMLKQKNGNFIYISSIYGLIGFQGYSGYGASKAALAQFSKSIAIEYGPYGIRSNTISPGIIETNMTAAIRRDKQIEENLLKRYPIGRFGLPRDVANACLFLASDQSSFITGINLPVDGGYTAQ